MYTYRSQTVYFIQYFKNDQTEDFAQKHAYGLEEGVVEGAFLAIFANCVYGVCPSEIYVYDSVLFGMSCDILTLYLGC